MNASGAVAIEAAKIITMFDINMPEVRDKFFRVRGDQGMNFFRIIESLGYSRPVASMLSTQYEEDWIHQSIHLGSTMTLTGTNEYTFTLSTTAPNIDYLEQNTTAPYDSADQYKFPVQVNDEITLPGGNNAKLHIQSVNISGSTCTVVALHVNPSATFNLASMTAGTELILTGNAWSEGSGQGQGKVWKPLKDTARTQIIKTDFDVTGSQMTQQIWFKEYSNGEGIAGYYIVGMNNTEYEHALNIDMALLVGALGEVVNVDPITNEPIYRTEGIESYIRRKGQNIPYVPGSWNIGEFDYADKLLEQQMAPRYMGVFMGTDLDNEKDNVFKDYFNNTSDQKYMRDQATTDIFGGNAGTAAAVNFRYFQKGYRSYCFTRLPQFNMVKLLGAPGYKYQNTGMMWPLSTKPDAKNPDMKIPYMGMIYKFMNGYSRKAEVWNVNGAGNGQKISLVDRNHLAMRSDIGAEHCGGNQMLRWFAQ